MFSKLIEMIMKHLGSIWSVLLIILTSIATILEVKYFVIVSMEEVIIYFFFTLVIISFILLIITKIFGLSNQDPFNGDKS